MLLEALRLGVDLIDTAHAYGRSEELIAEALEQLRENMAAGRVHLTDEDQAELLAAV
jgi:aryl-alcohol dehydrogenase-like predicted oxidoreductase